MTVSANPTFDAHMMAIALRQAHRGLGRTAPNPSVGAVIADETTGEVIARGWTQPGGRPHAEKEALRRAGNRARGKTMYVTLEPCAHTGRVPTCADAMLTAGLARVVCAIADPNPVISGSGFEQLRAAGVRVDVGLLADEARWLTLGHILRQTRQRPFVQLKLAVSADGRIAAGDGRPVWVTGEQARRRGHLLRAQADAILVGIGTVLADDPELTCRLPGLASSSPDRIVVDSALRTPVGARVLPRPGDTRPRVWIATVPSAGSAQTAAALAATGADIVDAGGGTDGVDLARLLETLAARGITRVLVEGGHTIGSAFLAADLVDEAVVFQNGRTLGDAGIAVLPDLGLADRARWHREDDVRIEDDVMAVYRRIARFICEDFE